MSPRRRKQVDPLEQAIERALAPGNFISYSLCGWMKACQASDVGWHEGGIWR